MCSCTCTEDRAPSGEGAISIGKQSNHEVPWAPTYDVHWCSCHPHFSATGNNLRSALLAGNRQKKNEIHQIRRYPQNLLTNCDDIVRVGKLLEEIPTTARGFNYSHLFEKNLLKFPSKESTRILRNSKSIQSVVGQIWRHIRRIMSSAQLSPITPIYTLNSPHWNGQGFFVAVQSLDWTCGPRPRIGSGLGLGRLRHGDIHGASPLLR